MNYGNFCFWSYRVPRSKPRLGKVNRHSLIVNWSDESFQNFIALVLFFRSKGGGGGGEGEGCQKQPYWRYEIDLYPRLPIAKIITSRLPTQKVSPESRWFFNLWFLFKQHTLILIRDSLQSDKIVFLILFGQIYIVQYFMLHVYYFMNA